MLALGAVCLALLPGEGPAQETGLSLSLAEALELARENNPGFQATRNDIDVAEWDVRSAYASLFPTASAGAGLGWQGPGEQRFGSLTASDLGFADQPSYYSSSFSLSVNYRLDGQTLLRPGQAKADRSGTEARVQAARVELDQQVTARYMEVLRQEDEVAIARRRLERSSLNLRLAEGQREVGRVTALDVQQAEVQVGRGEVAVLQAEQALRAAELQLLQWLGLPPRGAVTLTSTFELQPPAWEETELYAMALERNPTLRGLRTARSSSEYAVDMAKSNYLPSLSISTGISGFTQEPSSTDFLIQQAKAQVAGRIAQCQQTNDLYSRLADPLPPRDCSQFVFTDDDRRAIVGANDAFPFDFVKSAPSVSLSLSVPVFQGLGRQRQLEAAHAARRDADHQIREEELRVQTMIAVAVGFLQSNYRSAVIERRNQELADEQLRLAREQYRVGLIPFVDLVDAETVKAEADQALLAAIYSYHDVITDLEALVGRALRDPGGP